MCEELERERWFGETSSWMKRRVVTAGASLAVLQLHKIRVRGG